MSMLKSVLVCAVLGLAAFATPARGQTALRQAQDVPSSARDGFANLVDHIHLAAPDQAKGAEWYHAHFDAMPTPEGPDRVMLGTTRLIFQKTDVPKPSEESVLNSIGFSVADLDATMKKLQA